MSLLGEALVGQARFEAAEPLLAQKLYDSYRQTQLVQAALLTGNLDIFE